MQLVWEASGLWMAAWFVLLLVQGVLPVAIVYMTRHVVDSLTGFTRPNGIQHDFTYAIAFPFVGLGILLITEQILRSASQWVRSIQSERIQDYMTGCDGVAITP